MGKIFISYARNDYAKALELYDFLSAQGFALWLDRKDLLPGQEWKAEIKKAIRESAVFIACLSNNSVSKQGFVQVELKEALDVAQEMPERVIYIIPVRLDECEVPSRLSMYQWVDFFEIDDKERLTKSILLRVNPVQPTQVEQEKYFDAGERVKAVRNELGVSTSQFIEALDLSSQREYEEMENREKEFPLSLLKKLSDVSGINVEWLKHETGHKYEIGYIHLNPIADDLAYCASLNPQEYFLTVDKKQLHVGIVAQVSKYRFQVLSTGVSLDFWTWVDSHWAISRFYHFLKGLSDPWHDIPTVFLPTWIDKQLYDGEIHFRSALRNQNGYAVGFLYDLLDLEGYRLEPFPRSKVYGISSLSKIQDYFRRYLNQEQETKRAKKQLGQNFSKIRDLVINDAKYPFPNLDSEPFCIAKEIHTHGQNIVRYNLDVPKGWVMAWDSYRAKWDGGGYEDNGLLVIVGEWKGTIEIDTGGSCSGPIEWLDFIIQNRRSDHPVASRPEYYLGESLDDRRKKQ